MIPLGVRIRVALRRPIRLDDAWDAMVVRWLSTRTRYSVCWSHYIAEPAPRRPYRVCFECGHVYRTAADLVAAYEREVTRMASEPMVNDPTSFYDQDAEALLDDLFGTWPSTPDVPTADDIYFCQECVHDF